MALFPSTLKAEAKLTTGGGVSVAARELAALSVAEPDAAGVIAVLFVGGERELDGRWTIVDATDFHRRTGDSVSAARSKLVATARTQRWLEPLRRHVDALWPPFLAAFGETARRGHAELVGELEALHAAGRFQERLPRDRVLGVEHAANVRELVDRHGESDAGRLAQDLLAYLVAFAGYRKVTLNAVGVPDFVLEEWITAESGDGNADRVMLSLPRSDAERVATLCREAGDERLAREVEARLGRRS